jgi:hypothetical protein
VIAVISIDITADGLVTLNDSIMGQPGDRKLPVLRDWLKTTIKRFGEANPVVIRPAPGALQQRVIDVLDACAGENVKNLTFG